MSHFSFTRTAYDECALKKKNQETLSPFEWITDSNLVESKQVCYHSTSPFMQNPFKSIPPNAVDIENELRGSNFKNSKCPDDKYNPKNPYTSKFNIELNECGENDLIPEYTRVNKPCNIFSGMNINRFHPLCEDLQNVQKIHDNSFIGMNTRLQIKDTYSKKKLR